MDKIKVLHFVNNLEYGGIQIFLKNCLPYMNLTKVQPELLVLDDGKHHPLEDEFARLNIKVHKLIGIWVRRPGDIKKCLAAVDAFFSKNKYNIVHSHNSNKNLLILCAAKKYGVPIRIAHSHNSISAHNSTSFRLLWQKTCKTLISLFATHYFACSKLAAATNFSRKLIKSNRVKIINNGINTKNFIYDKQTRNDYRKTLGLENKFVIGHIGRFAYQKNHEFLIDVFAEVYAQNPHSVLLLIGEGELERDMRRKVGKLKLADAVRFLGVRPDIPNLLQAIDVFVLPSRFEGLGIVAIETQAAGLKTLASDAVPPEAQITDLFEYIPLNQSASGWAEIIMQYQGYERRNTYDEIVAAGFDMEKVSQILEKFYFNAIRKSL